MPIYEFACPRCRKIFNFLSKRLQPGRTPVCPKCGNGKMIKQMSAFAMPRGLEKPASAADDGPDAGPMPEPGRSAHGPGHVRDGARHGAHG